MLVEKPEQQRMNDSLHRYFLSPEELEEVRRKYGPPKWARKQSRPIRLTKKGGEPA